MRAAAIPTALTTAGWFIKFFIFLGPLTLLMAGISSFIRLSVRLFGAEELQAETKTEHITAENHSAFS